MGKEYNLAIAIAKNKIANLSIDIREYSNFIFKIKARNRVINNNQHLIFEQLTRFLVVKNMCKEIA